MILVSWGTRVHELDYGRALNGDFRSEIAIIRRNGKMCSWHEANGNPLPSTSGMKRLAIDKRELGWDDLSRTKRKLYIEWKTFRGFAAPHRGWT